jgi:hypothetical protein
MIKIFFVEKWPRFKIVILLFCAQNYPSIDFNKNRQFFAEYCPK